MAMGYASTNPFTNQVVATFETATDEQVGAALDRAQQAFPAWSRTPVSERAIIFRRAAELFEEEAERLGRLACMEMGKTITEAVAEIHTMVTPIFSWLADHGEEILAPHPLPDPGVPNQVLMTYEPQGIVVEIEPWNVPYYQASRGFAPAAIAGNVVVMKHASIVPQCAAAIVDVLRRAGLPDGVWQNVYATHDQVDRMITDPRVRAVTLTGSASVGAHVSSTAAAALHPSTMELGGSDAFVVLPDADLESTVQLAVGGRYFLSGQACISPKRAIVVNEVYDAFLAGVKQMGDAYLKPGDPMDPATTFAPLSSQSQADTVRSQIAQAVDAGATATEIGGAVPGTGAWVQPTVLTGVAPDNPVYHQEIFGPVLLVLRAADEDDAVRIANDSPYGLSGSVHSRDVDHAVEVARRIDTGMVSINMPVPAGGPGTPFGGVKASGFGREMGYEGVREFTNVKPITLPVGVTRPYATPTGTGRR